MRNKSIFSALLGLCGIFLTLNSHAQQLTPSSSTPAAVTASAPATTLSIEPTSQSSTALTTESIASQDPQYAATQFPIVFVHGMFGFDSLFGLFSYWHGIVPTLQKLGAQVFVTEVSPLNSTEIRGEQLLSQIQTIMARSGAKKVHIIGHSHGSPTARYVAGVRPDWVASVTSVGGANQPVPVASQLLKIHDSFLGKYTIAPLGQAIAWLISLVSQNPYPNDLRASLSSLSAEKGLAFNAKFPNGLPSSPCTEGAEQVNGQYYFAIVGNTAYTNTWDPSDWVFRLLSPLSGEATTGGDGLVPLCHQYFGKLVGGREYQLNHLDETNLFFGLSNPNEVPVPSIYVEHVHRLKQMGL